MGVDFLRNSGKRFGRCACFAFPAHAGPRGGGWSFRVGSRGGAWMPLHASIHTESAGSALCPARESVWTLRVGPREKGGVCYHSVTTAEWELLSGILPFHIENKHERTSLLLLPRFPWEIYSHWRRDMRDMAMACDLRTVGPLERNGSVEGGIIFRIEKKWGRAMPACPRDVSGGT